MKKITLLLLMVSICLSCSEDNFNDTEFENKIATICKVKNNPPLFDTDAVTFGFICPSYPSIACFDDILKNGIIDKFNDSFTSSTQILIPNQTIMYQGTEYIDLDLFINTSNLYPFIDENRANVVFEEVYCIVRNSFTAEPHTSYNLEINYLETGFFFSGPESAFIQVSFIIQ